MDGDAARDDEGDAAPVTALLLAYYRALESGAPLAPFYATDAAAGDLGPVVKFGSGKGEAFRGSAAVAAGLVTRDRLYGPHFQRLFPDVYAPAAAEPNLLLRSRAAAVFVGGRGVLVGYSAAELLGVRAGGRTRRGDRAHRVPQPARTGCAPFPSGARRGDQHAPDRRDH